MKRAEGSMDISMDISKGMKAGVMDRQKIIEMIKDSTHDFRQKHLLHHLFENNNDEYLLSSMDDLEIFVLLWDLNSRYIRRKILSVACENKKEKIIDHIMVYYPDNYSDYIVKYNLDYTDNYKPNIDDLNNAILSKNFPVVEKIINHYKYIDNVEILLKHFPLDRDILTLILRYRPDVYFSCGVDKTKENNEKVLQTVYSKLDEIKKMFVYDYEFKHYVKRYLEL